MFKIIKHLYTQCKHHISTLHYYYTTQQFTLTQTIFRTSLALFNTFALLWLKSYISKINIHCFDVSEPVRTLLRVTCKKNRIESVNLGQDYKMETCIKHLCCCFQSVLLKDIFYFWGQMWECCYFLVPSHPIYCFVNLTTTLLFLMFTSQTYTHAAVMPNNM